MVDQGNTVQYGLLLRTGLGLDATAVSDVFGAWNRGDLASFLIEITADFFRMVDPHASGLPAYGSDSQGPSAQGPRPLIDAILDRAGQKGTGKWTVVAAAELGVPIPTIAAAVDARLLSAAKDTRVRAEKAHHPFRGRLEVLFATNIGPP